MRVVELAEKTITAPRASRQRVAVRRRLYSGGAGRARFLDRFGLAVFLAGFFAALCGRAGLALIPAPRRARGSGRRALRSSRRRRSWRRRARAEPSPRARP